MKIAIGSDHVGYPLKLKISEYLEAQGHQVHDYGTNSEERTDYPIYGKRVADAVAGGEYERGVLICGTGVGISITANKVDGIQAVVCSEPYSARLARSHNNANILAFGARVVGQSMAEMILDEFLKTEFEGGRHQNRLDMIRDVERKGQTHV